MTHRTRTQDVPGAIAYVATLSALLAAAACHAAGGTGVESPVDAGTGVETPVDAPEVVAGSRLRPVYVQPDDGERYFSGIWYDTQLGIRCTFVTGSDGNALCVPTTQDYAVIPGIPAEVLPGYLPVYADPACTQTVAAFRTSCADRDGTVGSCPYVASRSTVGCEERIAVHRFGAALEVPADNVTGGAATTRALFQMTGAGCVAAVGARVTFDRNVSSSTGTVFLIDDVTDQFVAAVRRTGTPIAGLAPVWLEAQDGAKQRWGFENQPRGFRCGFRFQDESAIDPSMRAVATDGTRRCLPIENTAGPLIGLGLEFSDSLCTSPAVSASWLNLKDASCKPDGFLVRSTGNPSCPMQVSAWQLGDSVVGTAFTISAGTCTATGTDTVLYGSAEIPPSQMAAGSVGHPVGDHRIQTRWIETAAGRQFWSLWDRQLEVDCAPRIASDGTLRCLPITGIAPSSAFYADASCTTPLGGPADTRWCQLPYAFARDHVGQFHRVLGSYTGPIFQGSLDVPPSACSDVAPTFAGPMFTIGPSLAATTFVAISQTIE